MAPVKTSPTKLWNDRATQYSSSTDNSQEKDVPGSDGRKLLRKKVITGNFSRSIAYLFTPTIARIKPRQTRPIRTYFGRVKTQ
jgi:hypothetical protein